MPTTTDVTTGKIIAGGIFSTRTPAPIGTKIEWTEAEHYLIVEEVDKSADGYYQYRTEKISPEKTGWLDVDSKNANEAFKADAEKKILPGI